MPLTTTLSFFGQTESAINFYQQNLDAEVLMMMRFSECRDPEFASSKFPDKIFHATVCIGGTQVMASDVGCDDQENVPSFSGFALALHVDSTEAAEKYFAALAESGEVQVPLIETSFAKRYGVVSDRFGVWWKIISADDDVV